jgi:hypothetical protein
MYIGIFLITIYIVLFYSFKKIKKYTKTNNFKIFLEKLMLYSDNKKLQQIEINKEAKKVFKINFIGRFWFKLYLKTITSNKHSKNSYQGNINQNYTNHNSINKYLEIFNLSSREELSQLGKIKFNKKYKELSKKYHPDMPTGDKDKMVLLNEAREKLLLII